MCAPSGSWVHSLQNCRRILCFGLLSEFESLWKSGEEPGRYLETEEHGTKTASADFIESLNAFLASGLCKVIQFHENPSSGC
jgi:hypothetical protein